MDRAALLERKGEILHEARMEGNDTLDGLAGSVVYWQDVAQHAHDKRKEAERRIERLEAEKAAQYERTCAVMNYWYPVLGYDSANEVSYPAFGDSRARPAPRIERLEAALVEREARIMWHVDNPGKSWGLTRDNVRAEYRGYARESLESSGIIGTAVQKSVANVVL